MYCKGKVVRVCPCSGGLEVIVAGKHPGAFLVANCLAPALLDPDGPGLLGRSIEYCSGYLRFLDDGLDAEDPTSIVPSATPASHHPAS